MGENTRKSTPGKTLLGFAAVLGFVAALNVRDRVYRASHEDWYFPTAIGDEEVFAGLAELPAGAPAVQFEGVPLVVRERRLVSLADWAMEKVGRDDGDGHFLYRPAGGGEEDAGAGPETYFLKVESGAGDESRYVAVRKLAP